MCGGSKKSAPAPAPAPVQMQDPTAAGQSQAEANAAQQRVNAATILSTTTDNNKFGAELAQ